MSLDFLHNFVITAGTSKSLILQLLLRILLLLSVGSSSWFRKNNSRDFFVYDIILLRWCKVSYSLNLTVTLLNMIIWLTITTLNISTTQAILWRTKFFIGVFTFSNCILAHFLIPSWGLPHFYAANLGLVSLSTSEVPKLASTFLLVVFLPTALLPCHRVTINVSFVIHDVKRRITLKNSAY